MTTSVEQDPTKARLVEAAGVVFAEKGFSGATVREICQEAGANVAAVNYHFRDKTALYLEVLRRSMALAHEESVDYSCLTPEEALRAFIFGMIRRMHRAREGASWHVRIMAHELAQPTGALDLVVQEVIQPRFKMLRSVVSRLAGLSPDDEVTRMCAMSVIGQVVHYGHAWPVIERVCPSMEFDADRIASHIATFSIAAIRAVAANAANQDDQLI